jgi:hypothetical protein
MRRTSQFELARNLRDTAAEINAIIPDIENAVQRLDANYIARKMDTPLIVIKWLHLRSAQ